MEYFQKFGLKVRPPVNPMYPPSIAPPSDVFVPQNVPEKDHLSKKGPIPTEPVNSKMIETPPPSIPEESADNLSHVDPNKSKYEALFKVI